MKFPSAIDHAKSLIEKYPVLFKDCSATQLVIAQAMQIYMNDCHDFINSKQNINVFNNPEQNGLSEFQKEYLKLCSHDT